MSAGLYEHALTMGLLGFICCCCNVPQSSVQGKHLPHVASRVPLVSSSISGIRFPFYVQRPAAPLHAPLLSTAKSAHLSWQK